MLLNRQQEKVYIQYMKIFKYISIYMKNYYVYVFMSKYTCLSIYL